MKNSVKKNDKNHQFGMVEKVLSIEKSEKYIQFLTTNPKKTDDKQNKN